ncbi:MAG: 3-isopropylmalate dehydratase large subunit [Acidobacteria bacterium]|nr:3-isopropylmalate dehydratase large subunit [Acidobacteriota bacterium]
MAQTLLDKVWDLHTVRRLPTGQTQLFIGLHLIHEVTTPQAFAMLRERGLAPAFPDRIFGTMDHIIPTSSLRRPAPDPVAEEMMATLEANCHEHHIPLYGLGDAHQGIVHVIGPELGLTQPGMTIACGDSHTSTHGAFGALAFGIGTSQVRDVLASQCLAMDKPKLRRVRFEGTMGPGVTAKDLALAMIRQLGVNGGVGFAYEYAGDAVARMTMDERMTLCNLSIEGGARMGYVNPDDTTFAFLRGREHAPKGEAWDRAVAWWRSIASDANAAADDERAIDAARIGPVVTWGTNPGQSVMVDEPIPDPASLPPGEREAALEALQFMGFDAGEAVKRRRVDVAFIGSCTNARLSDLRAAASLVRGQRVARHVRGLVVPGSREVQHAAEAEGLDEVFKAAGFEWREPGCSLCLGMNDDKLSGAETCASSSNRNFRGRQGSPTGRTLLMSPAMVAAAAVAGEVVDVRSVVPRGGAVQ